MLLELVTQPHCCQYLGNKICLNTEYPNEILLRSTAFYQGLQGLIRQKRFSEEEIRLCLEIITCDPQYIYNIEAPRWVCAPLIPENNALISLSPCK